MNKANRHPFNTYWGLLRPLNSTWKLDLIEKLTASIQQSPKKEPNNMSKAFGAWTSENSAEEIIEELRTSRNTNRQIEAL